jgi:DIM1 family U5 snRNP protein
MAYLLPHLHSGWEVDQAILTEEDRVVVVRFGRDQDPTCMVQDEVLMSIADKVKNFAVIYLVSSTWSWVNCFLWATLIGDVKCLLARSFVLSFYAQVDIDEVQDFTNMYELYDDCTTMFFYRNKHVMVDLGTGNNNKINWALADKGELIDIIEMVYRGARKGRGLVISPKDYSTKYRY